MVLRFMVEGAGCRVEGGTAPSGAPPGSGSPPHSFATGGQESGFRMWGLGVRVQGVALMDESVDFRGKLTFGGVSGVKYGGWGFGPPGAHR